MDEMNITSAQYLAEDGENFAIRATIDGEIKQVPISEGNRHYAAIQKAVADGQLTIQEASE